MRKRTLVLWFNVAVAIGLSLVSLSGIRTANAATDRWEIVTSPSEEGRSYLWAVTAVKPNCVVAVGASLANNAYKPLIERWDGAQWNIVQSPVVPLFAELNGITSVPGHNPGGNDLWAVGYQGGSNRVEPTTNLDIFEVGNAKTLIMRSTDCGASWKVVNSPNPPTEPGGTNILKSVSAVSANDVWAVGYHMDRGDLTTPRQTLTEHWDGSTWSIVTSPNLPIENYLNGVDSLGPNKVWAAGYAIDFKSMSASSHIIQWDGAGWVQNKSDNPGPVNYPLAIEMTTANQGWVVGGYQPLGVNKLQTMTLRWNGIDWRYTASPNQGTGWNVLHATGAIDSNWVWAVGRYQDPAINQSIIEKWDGTSWQIVPSPPPGTGHNGLRGVTTVPGTSVCNGGDSWAVGYNNGKTLIERYTLTPACTKNTIAPVGMPTTGGGDSQDSQLPILALATCLILLGLGLMIKRLPLVAQKRDN